jgi:hypothetical protein
MDDEAHTKKRLQIVAENTIRNRAAQGRHYPKGTAEAMVKAAIEQPWGMKRLDAMDRVLAEAEGA